MDVTFQGARLYRGKMLFILGVNDDQSDSEQKHAPQFMANYETIIDFYRNTYPGSDIVILPILSPSVHEKNYYAGQEESIQTWGEIFTDSLKETWNLLSFVLKLPCPIKFQCFFHGQCLGIVFSIRRDQSKISFCPLRNGLRIHYFS